MSYPSNWTKIKFGEIARRKSVRVANPNESNYERYVGLEHLDSGELVVKRWGSTKDVVSSMQLFSKNDILFARRNTGLRRVSVALFDGVCSGDIIVIEPILKHIVVGFLPIYMQFEDFENRIIAWSAGAFSKRIKWKQLSDLDVHLPSKEKQQEIADIIWGMNATQERTEALIQIGRRLKAGLMQELLIKGLGHKEFKESTIGRIPEEWEVSTVGRECKVGSGGTPSRSQRRFFEGDIPWVKSTEIDFDRIEKTGEHITQDALDHSSAKIYPAGTLLMAIYGQGVTRGKSAILGIDAAVNQAIAAIQGSDRVHLPFLFYWCQRQYNFIRSIGQGSNQLNFNLGLVKALEFPVPPIDEQKRLARILSTTDKSLESDKREEISLKVTKRMLTNLLLSGKARVRD